MSQENPAATEGTLRLRVARVVRETDDARSFVFEVPEALRDEFAYAPGQYVAIEALFEGLRIRRCYSLSSAPGIDDAPQVTVKRVAGGRMSNLLIDGVREGDTLTVHPPAGRFVLEATSSSRPLSLFAGGSGITPVLSIIKAALAQTERPVRLLYANRDEAATIFARELDALAEAYPGRFELSHHRDDQRGLLTHAALTAWIAEGIARERRASDHYVCGPAPFMEAVRRALHEAKVDEARVRVERFISPADPDRRVDSPELAPTEAPDDFLVTLGARIHRVPYGGASTLLAACKTAGVKAPFSCEDGFCGSCMARLVEGDVAMESPLALSERDIASGLVLACQARPTNAAFLHVDFDAVSFGAAGSGEDGLAPRLSPLRAAAVVALASAAALAVRWLHTLV